MQDSHLTPPSAPHLKQDEKAEIVDRLYEVALDPIRLEDLLEVWENSVAAQRTGHSQAVVTLEDAEIEAHLRRASVFLDRMDAGNEAASKDGASRDAVLDEIARSAAFVADGGPAIIGYNRAAALAFGLRQAASLADLPFDPTDAALLRAQIAKIASGRDAAPATLRLRSTKSGVPVILRVAPVAGKALALVVSTELVWPAGFEATVQEAFGLTAAEVDIVRGIALGLPVKDIAEARGRSTETVRTQLRSILAKTETHSQSELVRVVLALMEVVQAEPVDLAEPASKGLSALPVQHLVTKEGRRLEWIEFGDPKGAPLLFMHLDFGFTRWPLLAEHAASKRGIRVIVPYRAGFGRSDLHGKAEEYISGVVNDYLAVLDRLAVTRTAVICQGADLRFAAALSIARPGLVTGILGCAAQLPLRHAAQYERMDKWQRFILANARYAPKVLPFLVQAGYSLARKLGKEKFFTLVNGGSPADMAAFAKPDIREAILLGTEVALGAKTSAHQAFTRECLSSEKDWSQLLQALVVPTELLQGDQDPQTPVETVRELMADFPQLDIQFVPNTGQLLFFAEWPLVLKRLERFLPND
jgi:pimeloyl-ACP methyl ester carboxylesterase/DNA-binding CsgD family transcriptional regulator